MVKNDTSECGDSLESLLKVVSAVKTDTSECVKSLESVT